MAILPTTSLARVGLGFDLAALAAYAALLMLAARSIERVGLPVALGWGPPVLAMAIGSGLALAAILRQGERSVVGWLALAPGGFLLGLVAVEALGLMG